MTRLLRLDGRNVPVRAAAITRLAMIPLLPLFEGLSRSHGRPDAWFADPMFALLVVYALAAAAYAFCARGDVPLAPFVVADVVLLGFITWGENDPTSDVRFMLFVRASNGDEMPIADGGSFDWIVKLTSRRGLALVCSGMGAQLIPLLFRAAP